MTEQITLTIEGQRVKVDRSFLQLPQAEQERTVEEIARSLNVSPGNRAPTGAMAQVNQGIAESVGGLLDFVNPFDTPHVSQALGMGDRLTTGSAKMAIERGMDRAGIARATGDPRTGAQSFARGVGQAAGGMVPAGATATALSRAGGLLGRVARSASAPLISAGGAASELLAGGAAKAAQDAAERQGAPEWAQQTAGLLGGMATGAVPYVASRTPTALGVRQLNKAVRTAAMPYTETGAREVARQRVQELAGGPDRAAALANEIANGSEIGLTAAQQTDDPNMLAIEQTAARQDPNLRNRLSARVDQSRASAEARMPGADGDVRAAQSFFEARRTEALQSIQARVDRATRGALRPSARNSEMENSETVARQLREAEMAADAEEASLWAAVPKGAQVGTENMRRVASELIQATPRAQRADIPRTVTELLAPGTNDGFGAFETVAEVHGLYSELRRTARSAMAGNDQNRNMARIANAVADAALDDLGAGSGVSEIGRAIDAARAYSAAKHQTFDQGNVGRLLKRTLDGDDRINPSLTLESTVGRGGSKGALAYDEITRAADTNPVQNAAEDFLLAAFDRASFKPDGGHNPNGALRFLRDNAELLERMPYLRETFVESLRTQQLAGSLAARVSRVSVGANNPRLSAGAAFEQAAPERAVDQVFAAQRPSAEAAKLARTGRKDPSGQAMAGLKAAFSGHVIRNATGAQGLSGQRMQRLLKSPETRMALTSVLSGPEMRRMDVIASELAKLDRAQVATPSIGGLSNRSPNRVIEFVARVAAARHGAEIGGGAGGSLQTAQMASSRVKGILGRLQNDKAEQMLIDAVEDPELFRALLMDPGTISVRSEQYNRLAPYLVGTMSGATASAIE